MHTPLLKEHQIYLFGVVSLHVQSVNQEQPDYRVPESIGVNKIKPGKHLSPRFYFIL